MRNVLSASVGHRAASGRFLVVIATIATVIALAVTSSSVANAVPVSPEPSVEPTRGDVDDTLPGAIEADPSAEPEPETAPEDSAPADGGLAEALEGFGDVSPEDAFDVASGGDTGIEIANEEANTGAPEPVVPLQHLIEVLEVGGVGGEELVQGLSTVGLSEAIESAYAHSDVDVPADTAIRGDLVAEEFPRAAAGDEIQVQTIPLTGDEMPGAAFALELKALDPDADAQWLGVELDISQVRHANGGDFGGRLQLMAFPECVLITPEDPACSTGVPLTSVNIDGHTLTGVVPADAGNGIRLEGAAGFGGVRSTAVRATDLLSDIATLRGVPMSTTSQGTIVAAVAGVAGPGGTFAKTDLAPVGQWSVAQQSGAFTYQVPLEVPPVEAGPVPNLALSYNSQIIDGHTPASNGQSSWIADGWDMQFGYIERLYNQCSAEGVSSGATLAVGWSGFTKVLAPGDFNNDGHNDVVGVTAAGVAHLFLGDGAGGLSQGVVFGGGWQNFTATLFPGDFSGDGNVDMITRTSNGDLWIYKGDGNQSWINSSGIKIGNSWNIFVEILAPGDFSGDGNPDIIGRESNGVLRLYTGNGAGGFATAYQQIGTGFNMYSRHITAGDVSGDGKVDFIGVLPGGGLHLFRGNGASGWLNGQGLAVTGGWSNGPSFMGSGDLTGDGHADMVTIASGELKVFPGTGTGHGQTNKGNDLCWSQAFDPATYTVDGQPVTLGVAQQASYVMSLGGSTYQLFPLGNDVFRTSPDSGIVVERKNRGPGSNGDDFGEYFRVWTPDGGVAYFGYGHNGSTATDSVATVQNWANDGGPECVNNCQQGYRWMLDVQVDSALNAAYYTYTKETNRYAQSGAATYNDYTSAIYPESIEYGGRFTGTWDAPEVSTTQARVEFVLTGRCVENTITDHSRAPVDEGVIDGCAEPTAAATSFPDVPADLICTGSCNTTTQRTPAFFKQKRLARVDTFVGSTEAWTKVAAHTLYSTFPLPAGANGRTLWLDGVFTRYVGDETGSTPAADDLTTYAIAFDGALMNNRVDWTTEAGRLEKRRLTGIRNEMGGYVNVNYERTFESTAVGGPCPTAGRTTATPKDGLDPEWHRENTWECFRAKGNDGLYGLYHRHLVSSVDLIDAVAGQPTQTFTYTYEPASPTQPLWAYADSILDTRNASNVDKQEFSTFLGYPKVTVTTGAGDTKSSTVTYFHSGRQGTWDGEPGTVTTGITDAVVDLPSGYTDPVDHGALRGMPALVQSLDSQDRVIGATVYTYNVITTADGPYGHDATVVQTPLVTSKRTEHETGGAVSRTSSIATTYDDDHPWLAIESESIPDTAASTVNVSRSTTEYTFDSTDYDGLSEWSSTAPAPFFHLPIAGESYLDPGTGEVLTGQWETSYLEPSSVMRGLPVLERQRVTDGTGDEAWLESTATYDSIGRILTAKGPAETSNNTEVSWDYTDDDVDDGLRHIAVTNQVGWVTHQWVEPRFGNVVKTQDANDRYTHYKYDVGGLLVAGWADRDGSSLTSTPPADTVVPHVYYGYDVYGSALSVRTEPVAVVSAQFVGRTATGTWESLPEASTVRRSYEFLDGFGRTVESHTVAPNGTGRLVTQVAFDDVGRVVRQSDPYHDASEPAQVASGLMNGQWVTGTEVNRIPRFTETMYDASGRVSQSTLKVLVGGSQQSLPLSSSEFGLDWSRSTSLTTGASTWVETDTLGRTIRQIQSPETGHTDPAIETEYDYTVTGAGSVVTVTDDDGEQTVFTSDLGGRRTELADPNSGVSSYVYNALGQVEKIVSAAGTVDLTYDHLGRMKDRITTDPSSNVSSSAHWQYSEVEGELGLLLSETATTVTPAGAFPVVKTYTYNPLNQLETSTIQLPNDPLLGDLKGISYTTEVSYDALGAATAVKHDAIGGLPEQTVTTGLDILGRARMLTVLDSADERMVVTGTTFDTLGRLATRTYGNGTQRAYTWDAKWGSLATVSASFNAGAEVVQADTYLRDTSGRVTSVTDSVEGITQCYVYDGFNRLDVAFTDIRTTSTCEDGFAQAIQPVNPDPREPLAYAVDYAYDPTGQVDTIENLLTTVTSTYAYADTSHPNAVTAVTDGTTTDSFTYDDAGRMVTRTVDSTLTDLVWDVSSNMVATSGQGGDIVYLYDAGGQRVAQVKVSELSTSANPVSATVYLGATQVTDPDTNTPGDVNATRYFTFGGSTVATATSTAGAAPVWALLFGDIQGSAQVMMELVVDTGETTGFEAASTTHTVTRDAYMPYGAERDSSLDLSIDRGWLGQIEDTGTGLTYLNARYYDPAIGRFISPDPLIDPGDPRTLDPYRYADNNPIVFHDITGLSPSCFAYKGDVKRCWENYSFNARDGYTTYIAFTKQQLQYAKLSPEDRRATRSGYTNYYGGGHSPIRVDNSARTHTTLDVIGAVPVVGEPFDAVNAALYASEGKWGYAGLSAASAVPFFGWIANGMKTTMKSTPQPQILTNKFNGDAARDALLAKYPGAAPDKWVPVPGGTWRSVDILTPNKVAIEVKSGYTSLTSSIREQVAKDVALRAEGTYVEALEWSFVRSSATNQIGPSKPLLDFLHTNGITVKVDGVTIQPPPVVG